MFNMADVNKEIKKKRSRAKGNFTTKLNNLGFRCGRRELRGNAAYDQVLMEAWDSLNAVHDVSLDATEVEAIETDPLRTPYLDEPAERYRVVMRKYAAFLKRALQSKRSIFRKKKIVRGSWKMKPRNFEKKLRGTRTSN